MMRNSRNKSSLVYTLSLQRALTRFIRSASEMVEGAFRGVVYFLAQAGVVYDTRLRQRADVIPDMFGE